jgi:hypothetical protein
MLGSLSILGFSMLLLAVESLHGILNAELLDRIERLVKRGGLVMLTLPRLSKELRVIDLTRRGYRVYRYLLRASSWLGVTVVRFLRFTALFGGFLD